jgi:hypothetical protein
MKTVEQSMYLFKFYSSKGEIENVEQPIKTAFEILKSFSSDDFKQYFLEIQSTRDVEGQIQVA